MLSALVVDDYCTFEKGCGTLDEIEEDIIDENDANESNPELDWMHDYLFYKRSYYVDLVIKAEDLDRKKYVLCLMNSNLGSILVDIM